MGRRAAEKQSKKAEIKRFDKGQVVLAKYRNYPPWPAVISSVYPNEAGVTWVNGVGSAAKRSVFKIKWSAVESYSRPTSDDPALNSAATAAEKIIQANIQPSTSNHQSSSLDTDEDDETEVESMDNSTIEKRNSPEKTVSPHKSPGTTLPATLKGINIPAPEPSVAAKASHQPILMKPRAPPPPPFSRGQLVWAKVQRWPEFPSIVLGRQREGKFVVAFLPLTELPLTRSGLARLQKFKASEGNMRKLTRVPLVADASEEMAAALSQAEEILSNKHPIILPQPGSPTRSPPKQMSDIVTVDIGDEADEEDAVESAIKVERAPSKIISEAILSDEGKERFLAMFRGDVDSERAKIWRSLDGEPMPAPPSFGPLVDESDIEDVIQRLIVWLVKDADNDSSLRNAYAYVITVGIPESVRWALGKVYGMNDEESEAELAKAKPIFRTYL